MRERLVLVVVACLLTLSGSPGQVIAGDVAPGDHGDARELVLTAGDVAPGDHG